MKLHAVDPLEDDRWPRFLARQEQASIFHTRGWLEALRRTYGYTPVVYTTSGPEEELQGGIPFCRVESRLTGNRLVSVPFADHCDPLVDSASLEELIAGLPLGQSGARRKYVELRPLTWRPDPASRLGPSASYHLHRIDLTPSLEKIRERYHRSSVVRKIRRSEREGLEYSEGRSADLLDQFYGLFVQTRKGHLAPPPPKGWFRNLADSLGERVKICVAAQHGRPVASIIVGVSAETHFYKYGCSDPGSTRLGGTAMLFDRAISDAKQQGARLFDLGRSDLDQEGLCVFKERWGGERSTLTYYRSPAPKSLDSTRSARFADRARRLVARLPDPLFVALGRILYRHLG